MPSFFFHVAFDLCCRSSHLQGFAGDTSSITTQVSSNINIFNIPSSSNAQKIPARFQPTAAQILPSPPAVQGPTLHGEHVPGLLRSTSGTQGGLRTNVQVGSGNRKENRGAESAPGTTVHDWRYDNIFVQSIDMLPAGQTANRSSRVNGQISNGIGAGSGGLATKGRYEATELEDTELGWGIVHLYRDAEETPGLNEDVTPTRSSRNTKSLSRKGDHGEEAPFRDEDCTTLCILAVPSYLTPSDFLGFVGEKTRDDVSHFRMIRTERVNRYMVLMKFRNGKRAREWRKEWNGKAFNSMEPENCHVVFVKSIEFRTSEAVGQASSFPDMTNDPFTPSVMKVDLSTTTSTSSQAPPIPSTSLSTKPKAPPTPALVELPTCPVCLERMDESTGLLTILCQHVFHCSCLQKWKGSGCPVCRYTQDDLGKKTYSTEEDLGLNECTICRSDANLWICLICGNIGCGRYDAAHAFLHYQQSSHCFAMDLNTQRVWDYASDGYVHRIAQNKTDGKLVELPSALGDYASNGDHDTLDDDYVPRAKLDNIGMEYTHLLTSQLDSQRMYFEEKVERAADKASQANAAAEKAAESARQTLQQLLQLQEAHDSLAKEAIPALERDKERTQRKAEKFEGMARKLEKEWREEKAMNGSLMERIEFMSAELKELREANRDLSDQNRDLSFFISGQEKLKDAGEEIQEGILSIPDPPAQKEKGRKGRR